MLFRSALELIERIFFSIAELEALKVFYNKENLDNINNFRDLKLSFQNVLDALPSSENKQVIDVVKSDILEMRNAVFDNPKLASAIEKSMLFVIEGSTPAKVAAIGNGRLVAVEKGVLSAGKELSEKSAWAKYGKPAAIGATALAGIGGLAWMYNNYHWNQSRRVVISWT